MHMDILNTVVHTTMLNTMNIRMRIIIVDFVQYQCHPWIATILQWYRLEVKAFLINFHALESHLHAIIQVTPNYFPTLHAET